MTIAHHIRALVTLAHGPGTDPEVIDRDVVAVARDWMLTRQLEVCQLRAEIRRLEGWPSEVVGRLTVEAKS